jgi:hypothetical protein
VLGDVVGADVHSRGGRGGDLMMATALLWARVTPLVGLQRPR